ncbi:MAG: pitrilysin family protein [archaeon]
MKFEKKVLKSGLTVLHEKRDVPVTTVMLAARYGSIYETIKEKGIAHFIEHLCFKGTERRSVKQIAGEVEKVGGVLNAFTSEEVTAYHVKLPSEHLGVAMDVIFDVFFNASFPEVEVEKEAGVICEEIKMYHDNPHAHVLEGIKTNLYEGAAGMSGAGTEENVRRMTREQLFNRHREVYVPSNAILCVVGNNNFDEIVSIAEKFDVASRKSQVASRDVKVKKRVIKNSEKREGVQQVNLAIGFHFPCSSTKERCVAEVFSAILGEGMSSKLFSEVREKRGLVYGIKTELDLGKNYGYMVIWAGTDSSNEKKVVDICLDEFRKMGEIGEEELAEAKVQVIGNRRVESEGSSETAVNLIVEELDGDAKNYYNYEKNINAVSLGDIKKLAAISEFASFSLGP